MASTADNTPLTQNIAQQLLSANAAGTLALSALELKNLKEVVAGTRPATIIVTPGAAGSAPAVKGKITLQS
jgi:hypothetical protein